MQSDEVLWMKAAMAALGRGRGLVDALDAADSTVTMFWRARDRAIRPGLSKCPSELSEAGAIPQHAMVGE